MSANKNELASPSLDELLGSSRGDQRTFISTDKGRKSTSSRSGWRFLAAARLSPPAKSGGFGSFQSGKPRCKYPRVLPKYRNPQTSETWSGRGKRPVAGRRNEVRPQNGRFPDRRRRLE